MLFTALFFSCSKDSSSSTTDDGGSNVSVTNTGIKLTAVTAAGVPKQNYIVMMFDQPVTTTNALPPIKKQVITDAAGLAYFDLKTLVTSTTPTTYYFEAFVQTSSGYEMKSIIHPNFSIAKGQVITSSIIVN